MTTSHRDTVQWNNEIVSRFDVFFSFFFLKFSFQFFLVFKKFFFQILFFKFFFFKILSNFFFIFSFPKYFFQNLFSSKKDSKFFPIFFSNFFLNNLVFQNFVLQSFFLNIFFQISFSIFFCLVQKGYQRGFPNDFRDVRSKNVTNMGSRMTSGMFGPKTLPTRGPERPFRCLDLTIVNWSWFQGREEGDERKGRLINICEV